MILLHFALKQNRELWKATALAVALIMATSAAQSTPRPFRLHCTLNGKPTAEWREKAGQYRVKLDGEWSTVPPDAAGPMMVLLWAGGARCARQI